MLSRLTVGSSTCTGWGSKRSVTGRLCCDAAAGVGIRIRIDPLPLERLGPAGEHTLRVFAAQDALEQMDDAELLGLAIALTKNHRLQQTLTARDVLVVESQTLELLEGLHFTVGVDRHTVSLLPHFDGRR